MVPVSQVHIMADTESLTEAGVAWLERLAALPQPEQRVAARVIMPAALVLNRANPIMVQSAAFAGFTMLSGFALDITAAAPDGALVEVDPEAEPPCLRVLAAR